MVVKKFYGATTRDALRQVRDELGPDALILSNRQVAGGGIEIMAVADADVAAITSTQTAQPAPKPSPRAVQNGARLMRSAQEPPAAAPVSKAIARSYAIPDDDEEPTLDDVPTEPPPPAREEPLLVRSNRPKPQTLQDFAVARQQLIEAAQPAPAPVPPRRPPEKMPTFRFEDEAPESAEPAAPVADKEAMEDIAREIRMLRGLLESQLAGMAWGELAKHAPEKLEALRQLLAVGFCPALARQLIDKMPSGLGFDQGLRWIKAAIAHNLPAASNGEDLITNGGTYALIGPTGVGKTTTVAKLAARCALMYGPESVALLTTDSYRIGAHDQLRIYGRIIGVPVHEIRDDTDLELTLADLSDRHLVLIDTVGMGQRDTRVGQQLKLFEQDQVQTLLLLAANAAPATLDDVARRYQNQHLAGCIVTKLDEAMSLGGCLDVAIRHKLKLHFITNGQRVPEDLHGARIDYLIDRTFRGETQKAFQLQNDEYPLFMGASGVSSDKDIKLNLGGIRG
ncbi:flagellar biosynthesis protein FlhF [Andreprevotia lacus DSM 23236]|jgi:flagellar biosynthesis protein FlhF|uniref:Flagellar biosynthesis protein FlhF n=1 Tax=Andreprevotia lacus DSM 23236 TaxID=1121001 RepID=A0A1W1XQP1_9NEIS|nr:flagellar biosynthesis protein FlhF [Andreprevotia lacus]SMC26175.1 flagellar biosynthesis protein FlhF [Andreprevotia lacus DSM 23236]